MVVSNYKSTRSFDQNFEPFSVGNQQPCNLEAEEAILGGVLLDPTAIARVSDTLKPEMFFLRAHTLLFDCFSSLHASDEIIDPITVQAWLSEHELLEKVGGTGKLFHLLNNTVSSINIDRYARIVLDKFQRREIIRAGNEIAEMGYRSDQELLSIHEKIESLLEKPATNEDDAFKRDYDKLIAEIEKIIKGEINPGVRFLKLNKLAFKYKKEYGLQAKGLEDLYFRDLVNREFEPFMNWKDLKAKYENQEQDWLMRGIIPAGATILCHAPGGTGKTRFFYRMMQRLVERVEDSYFSLGDTVKKVAIIQTDESAAQSIATLTNQGMVTDGIEFKTKWTIEQIPQLRKEIEEMEIKPRLLLIDNLSTISRYSMFSENDMEYARPILLLNEIARDFNITIVLIHHSNKAGSIRGTTAITNSVDLELKIEKDPQDQSGEHRLLTIGKTRMRRPAQYKFLVDWDTNEWHFIEETGEENNSLTSSAKDALLKFLRENRGVCYECEELAEVIGSSIGNTRKVAATLAADGLIQKKRLKRHNKKGYYLPNSDCDSSVTLSQADRSVNRSAQLTAELPNALPESAVSIPDPCASKNEIFSTDDCEKKSILIDQRSGMLEAPSESEVGSSAVSYSMPAPIDQLDDQRIEETTQRLLDPTLTYEQYIEMWEEDLDLVGLAVSQLSEQYQERLKNLAPQPELVITKPLPTKDLSLLEVGDRITRGNQVGTVVKIYPKRIYRKYEISIPSGKKQELSLEELRNFGYKVCSPLEESHQMNLQT